MPVKALWDSSCERGERSMWDGGSVVVVVVVGVSEGLRKASWAVGRWSRSRTTRCRIKDLA